MMKASRRFDAGTTRWQAIRQAEVLEADFSKWRRRSVTPSELGAPDYSTARKALDKRFVSELAAVNRVVQRACD